MAKKIVLSTTRRKIYELDAETINYYRRNPVIACEDLLGIYLSDAQAWILASAWNAERSVLSCSRNFGKSYLVAIFCILRAILYPNQNIYIISSVGNQAKETFTKLEQLITGIGKAAESSPDLKDIVRGETVKSDKNKDGFIHNPASYTVKFYNGSQIFTLNSKPDNARGFRSSLTVYDEAAYIDEDLINATEPYSSQSADAQYGENVIIDQDLSPLQPPNQIIYASSQGSIDTLFYQRYKEYAKKMIAGDRNYFVCDMPCDTAMTMYHKGYKIPPLLSQSVVDDAMKLDKEKALREYYNQPDLTGGVNQIIKWKTIRKNEKQIIPYIGWKPENKIVLALDPARTIDNSILMGMQVYDDPDFGTCGDIISCTNFVDLASRKKYKLDSNRQLSEIRHTLLAYNGTGLDYEFIDSLLVDSGSGGGGTSTYADHLLNDWTDDYGKTHKGLIDLNHDVYVGYRSRYPNAVDKLRLINPKKYRTQMIQETIELMELGVLRFPYSYSGQEFLQIPIGLDQSGEEIFDIYNLSQDEIVNFSQIEKAKTELAAFHRYSNAENTSVTYSLAKEKQNKMHDDRAYCVFLLAHRLYELRRGKMLRNRHTKKDISQYIQFRAPKIF